MAQPDVPEWNPDDKTPYVYVRLADHIQARIEAGHYPPGGMLPNEREMVPEYGVSIDTVRRALGELRKRGLVVTYPSRGTYVTGPAELPEPPRREPARHGQDASGRILSCPDQPRGIPLASPGMTEDDDGPRFPFRNAEYRYLQVADDIERRIRAGEFPYDSALPRRGDLAAEYGAGEMTVRHALRVLAERGMVRPMPSVGTVVIWAGQKEGT